MANEIYFEEYLKKRTKELGMSLSELAKKAGISRQTIYKLLNGEIEEAKTSTLVALAKALKVHQYILEKKIFWELTPPPTSKLSSYPGDYSGFVTDVTYPDNEIVTAGHIFIKSWTINNLGRITWEDRRLKCVDDQLEIYKGGEVLIPWEEYSLVPLEREVPIPTTKPEETVDISVTFRAPIYPCTTISYWKIVDAQGEECFPQLKGLWCKVQVVAL